jgi:hypothetical protein
MDLHRLGEERSIEMHRFIAQRLGADAGVLSAARARVDEWVASGSVHATYAQAWRDLLSLPMGEIAAMLTDPGERMRALRQCSPFAGAIDPRTRWQIRRAVARAHRE